MAILVDPIIADDYFTRPVPLRPPVLHQTHVIPLGAVASVEKDNKQEGLKTPELPSIGPIRVDRLMRREQRNIAQREREWGARAPHGATEEAMAIFAALAKTLPCKWHRNEAGKDDTPIIVVLDEVHICPPYRPSSCRGTIKSDPSIMERVRKVLEGERRRLGLD